MGFRAMSYATVWEVSPISPTMTKGRISISKKNKQTDQYETDFSGFVTFIGKNAAERALSLHEKDRIRLKDIDVTNTYDKASGKTYTNFKIFDYELPDSQFSGNQAQTYHRDVSEFMNVQEGDPDTMVINGDDGAPW